MGRSTAERKKGPPGGPAAKHGPGVVRLSCFHRWAGSDAAAAAAAGMAASLARGLTQEELSRLAAFFTVLGDLLALYALDAPEGRQNAPPTGP